LKSAQDHPNKIKQKSHAPSPNKISKRIAVAMGADPADLVIKNVSWLDVFNGLWHVSDVAFFDGVIVGVGEQYDGRSVMNGSGLFLVPGFIDSHVHIESSMMTPHRFQEVVLPRGTTTAIWDPHEIANVKGLPGIDWALKEAATCTMDIFVMIPSCVPSTEAGMGLETSGAVLKAQDLEIYRNRDGVLGLAEMMNWPGLVNGNSEVIKKLHDFQGMVRDGHCPELSGKALNAYAAAGIHSCHESTTLGEAQEKLSKGIHVLVREGSCAKDASALLPLVTQRSAAQIGFCSDDRNPLDIEESGHIDCIVNMALRGGHDPIEVFRSASFAAAKIYGLNDRGAIAPGYLADVVLLKQDGNWKKGCEVVKVWKNGAEIDAQSFLRSPRESAPFLGRNINIPKNLLSTADLALKSSREGGVECRVIGVRPGQIVTDDVKARLACKDGLVQNDLAQDIIKIAVFERHHATGNHGVALVQGFGIKSGAIATSINHDCHNLIVTGSSDESMLWALQELLNIDGGIVVVSDDGRIERIKLSIGGLMTADAPKEISASLRRLKSLARSLGCVLDEPFLQLSFLALPVIPTLKITDRGLVDGRSFKITDVVHGAQN
jgi:adenine deaminase